MSTKVKIFAVSDIHSFCYQFLIALKEAGFQKNNPAHLLVICGDMFDRGDESEDLLTYLKGVKNKVIVKGNHETLIEEMMDRGEPYAYDYSNGTANTVCDLSAHSATDWWSMCQSARVQLAPLLKETVNYFETKNYIFVHSFIPLKCKKYYTKNRKFEYDPNWREVHASDFENSRWGDPFNLAAQGLNQTGKTIVHGHWHNSTGWTAKGIGSEWGKDACFDICKHDDCIGLDACTARSNKVNVLVVEDELLEDNK